MYVLTGLLLVVIVVIIGIVSRRVSHLLLLALALCGLLIVLVMALLW